MKSRAFVAALALATTVFSAGWTYINAVAVGVDMTRAADQFVKNLDDDQRKIAQMEYDTPQRVGWHFIPKANRKGLQIKEMNDAQRTAAHGLLKSCLSNVGYDKAVKIMELEHILFELERSGGGSQIRDTERYYFTVFGQPTEKGKWGLSIEGHHLSLNFVVEAGAVVSSTPTFFAANPATVMNEVPGGAKKGTRVLAGEELLAFELVNSLDDQQRQKAVIAEKAPREIRAAGEPQPPTDDPVGLAVADMTREQKMATKQLVLSYLENLPESVHQARIDAATAAGPENIHFAWAGALKPGVGHYYRVQGPTFLIEFVNTQPDAAGNPANHIHCVWRDMKGDFALPIAE